MLKRKLSGVVVPIVTPASQNDGVDFNQLEQNALRLLEEDIDGMYICGGTGDGGNLTLQERRQVAGLLIPKLASKEKSAIVHVGSCHQRQAVELAYHAGRLGADAVAAVPPGKDWRAAAEFYQALAQAGLPVVIYYIPMLTGATAGMDELSMLLSIEGVAGIKVSDWNMFLMYRLKQAFPDKLVYSGFDEMLLTGLAYGADGSIGTWGNLFAGLYVRLHRHFRAGEMSEAYILQQEFAGFLNEAWKHGVLRSFEEMMRALAYADKCFRSPGVYCNEGPLPEKELQKLLSMRQLLLATV